MRPGTLQYSPTTLTPATAVRGPQFTEPNKHMQLVIFLHRSDR